jgi:hypothetical protein
VAGVKNPKLGEYCEEKMLRALINKTIRDIRSDKYSEKQKLALHRALRQYLNDLKEVCKIKQKPEPHRYGNPVVPETFA